jgi:hypothetical protein
MMKETDWSHLLYCSRKDDDGDCDRSSTYANSNGYEED